MSQPPVPALGVTSGKRGQAWVPSMPSPQPWLSGQDQETTYSDRDAGSLCVALGHSDSWILVYGFWSLRLLAFTAELQNGVSRECRHIQEMSSQLRNVTQDDSLTPHTPYPVAASSCLCRLWTTGLSSSPVLKQNYGAYPLQREQSPIQL